MKLTTRLSPAEPGTPQSTRTLLSTAALVHLGLGAGDLALIQPADADDVVDADAEDVPRAAQVPVKLWLSPGDATPTAHVVPDILESLGLPVGAPVVVTPLTAPLLAAEGMVIDSSVAISGPTLQYLRNYLVDLQFAAVGRRITIPIRGIPITVTVRRLSGASNADLSLARITGLTKVQVALAADAASRAVAASAKSEAPPVIVGGMERPLAEIRSLINSALFRNSDYALLNLRPPRGILLYGPPGTGKSLAARVIANETQCHFIIVNGPEIVSKFYGETEERVRELFEQARANAPCILFFDEIDALCPKRDASPTEMEKRVVATLLTLLDGATQPGQPHDRVFVIGATNRPNALDEAMRRPGRLDVEVEIGIPTPDDRCKILTAVLASTRHALTPEETAELAGRMHGYVGADLAHVVREAGVRTVRRVVASGGAVKDAQITAADLESAMDSVTPSAMRESVVQVPDVKWTDIGGNEHIKQALKESVEWPLKRAADFVRFGITPPKGILLYGPPGCSKTLVAKALANESQLNFLAVKGPELYSKWVGDSEKAINQIFRKARAAAPSIIFFDEIDAIAGKRSSGDGGQSVSDRVLSQLLNEMDGVEPLVHVTIVAATNRPDIIDPALLRPGRIDRILYVGPPDCASRLEILRMHARRMACSPAVDLPALADQLDGCSGAEVVNVCQAAALRALERDVDVEQVEPEDFDYAVANLSRRITPEMIGFYDAYRAKSQLANSTNLVSGLTQIMRILEANSSQLLDSIDPQYTFSMLADKLEFPTFFRTVPNDSLEGRAMVAFINAMGWRTVATITCLDSYGRSISSAFTAYAPDYNIAIVTKVTYEPDTDRRGVDFTGLIADLRQSYARIFVVLGAPDEAIDLLIAAKAAGLVSPEYVWVGPEAWSDVFQRGRSDSTTSALIESSSGFMFVFPRDPGGALRASVFREWQAIYPDEELPAYSMLYYDCVIALARGLVKLANNVGYDNVIARNYSFDLSTFISDFDGASGRVQFEANGNRKGEFAVYNIYNGSIDQIYHLSSNLTLNPVSPPRFFSGTSVVPRDRPVPTRLYPDWSDSSTQAFVGVLCVILIIVFLALADLVAHRHVAAVRNLSFNFLVLIAIGCALMVSSFLPRIGPRTDATCQLELRLFVTGANIVLASSAAKAYRIWVIFDNAAVGVAKRISNLDLLKGLGVALAAQAAVLGVWSIAAPLRAESVSTPTTYAFRCMSAGKTATAHYVAVACLVVLEAVLLVVVLVLAYKTRRVGHAYGESVWLFYAAQNVTLVGVTLVPFSLVDFGPATLNATWVELGMRLYAIVFTFYALVGRVVVQVRKQRRREAAVRAHRAAIAAGAAAIPATSSWLWRSLRRGGGIRTPPLPPVPQGSGAADLASVTEADEGEPGASTPLTGLRFGYIDTTRKRPPRHITASYPVRSATALFASWRMYRVSLCGVSGTLIAAPVRPSDGAVIAMTQPVVATDVPEVDLTAVSGACLRVYDAHRAGGLKGTGGGCLIQFPSTAERDQWVAWITAVARVESGTLVSGQLGGGGDAAGSKNAAAGPVGMENVRFLSNFELSPSSMVATYGSVNLAPSPTAVAMTGGRTGSVSADARSSSALVGSGSMSLALPSTSPLMASESEVK
ncbi:AAA+-type ATPase [Blastocladiella emersonii ATCC 22665]|nr:AAA+-type ATPase [Blastocladiella emersonii ATCC 22665]